MKKITLQFGLLLGIALLLSGCEKEIVSTALIVDETKTATFKIYVNAEFDGQNSEYETVSEQEMIVSVRKQDLNSYFEGQGSWSTTVPISNGVATFEIPATEFGCTIYVVISDFEHSYTSSMGENSTRVYSYNGSYSGYSGRSSIERIILSATQL